MNPRLPLRRQVRVAAAIGLGLLLAGCTTSDDTDVEPIVVTDPDDFSYAQNATGSGRPHIHDYWGSRDVIAVVDDVRGHQQGGRHSAPESHSTVMTFRPPAGTLVPLGTSHINITVTWTETWRIGDEPLELWVKTAADDEAKTFAQLEQDRTYSIPSDNERNDIPHQQLSAWEFIVAVPQGIERPDGKYIGSHFIVAEMTAVAVRGLEIPPYPPHPDLWDGATELTIGETTRDFFWHDGFNRGWYTDGGCMSCGGMTEIPPGEGSIIPFDADHIKLVADVDKDTEAMNDLRFLYNDASSRNWTEAPLVSENDGVQTYVIPVDQNGDSPYALNSLWRFAWRLDGEIGPYVSQGTFDLTVTVHQEAPR